MYVTTAAGQRNREQRDTNTHNDGHRYILRTVGVVRVGRCTTTHDATARLVSKLNFFKLLIFFHGISK
jgi:hypothetical protein